MGPKGQEPDQLIQAQSSTPDWLCYWSLCPPVEVQAEVNSQPTTGDKVPKGSLLQRRASEARRSPGPSSRCLPPLLRHSDSHSLSIQGCCGNCRLGQAPGAPSPPAAASPPVTLPVPTLGHSRTDPAARAPLGLRRTQTSMEAGVWPPGGHTRVGFPLRVSRQPCFPRVTWYEKEMGAAMCTPDSWSCHYSVPFSQHLRMAGAWEGFLCRVSIGYFLL